MQTLRAFTHVRVHSYEMTVRELYICKCVITEERFFVDLACVHVSYQFSDFKDGWKVVVLYYFHFNAKIGN